MPLLRETSIGYLTNWAGRLLVRELDRHLSCIGLSPAHMPVLLALEGGEATQKQIAAQASVKQETMTATLNRMERDGLVSRRPNPDDGRSMLVALTPLAREKLPQVEAAALAVNTLLLEQLTPEESGQFLDLLGRVIDVLQSQDETPSR